MNGRRPTICSPVKSPWLEWTASLGQGALQTLLFVLINIHLCILFLFSCFFLCSWSSAENWERFSHETFMKPEKWKDQKFRGREDIHIHNPSQPFFNVSSCVLGCLNLIFPLIITPKWRIKSRNWRAAIPQWHFPPVLEACWYIAVVSVTCNVKQA